PACYAAVMEKIVADAVPVRLTDAGPAVFSLLWRRNVQNPLVNSLATVARTLAEGEGETVGPRRTGPRLRAVPASRTPARERAVGHRASVAGVFVYAGAEGKPAGGLPGPVAHPSARS